METLYQVDAGELETIEGGFPLFALPLAAFIVAYQTLLDSIG